MSEVTSSARTDEFTKKLDNILSDWNTLTELTKRVRTLTHSFETTSKRRLDDNT